MAPPSALEDLTRPEYEGLLVVENPATSTPGLAFLLATVAQFGERGWQDYWRALRENDVLVVDGWEEAYTTRFSGAAGSRGTRPIVVSYASSPPAEVYYRRPPPDEAPTAVVESSCFRQVELAGILRGARNEEGARKLIDFMLSKRFQEDIPLSMFVFPVNREAVLPSVFERFAVVPESPLELPVGARSRRTARSGSTSGRGSCFAERPGPPSAHVRRAARLPRALLPLPARGHPGSVACGRTGASRRRSTSSPTR